MKVPGGVKTIALAFLLWQFTIQWTVMVPVLGLSLYGFVYVPLCVALGIGIVTVFGVFALKRWARRMLLLVTGFQIVIVALGMSTAMRGGFLKTDHPYFRHCVFLLIWGLGVCWYFLRPAVKAQFASKE